MQINFDRVFLVGSGSVAADCLHELKTNDVDVTYIAAGDEKFDFTKKLCARMGIASVELKRERIKDYLLAIKERSLIISAHNSYIFPAEITTKENLTIINLHIAYLPFYRGMNPPTWEIFNQEKYAGATWHTVNSKIDDGGIIVQERVPIHEDDTAMKLMLRCFQTGVRLFRENLPAFVSGQFTAMPIEAEARTPLYLARDLPNNGILNPDWDFKQACAFLRAMDYHGANVIPLPRIILDGEEFEIISYKAMEPSFPQSKEKSEEKGLILQLRESSAENPLTKHIKYNKNRTEQNRTEQNRTEQN